MSRSICGVHRKKKKGCIACETTVEDIPWWKDKLKEAQEAGIEECKGCGFKYYRTTNTCPKCGKERL